MYLDFFPFALLWALGGHQESLIFLNHTMKLKLFVYSGFIDLSTEYKVLG